ncbi:MAG: molybdopterin cofactor-binding domain-containing protein [Marinicella sp.]
MNRRDFIVKGSLASGGLLISLSYTNPVKAALHSIAKQPNVRLNLYLAISSSGLVTITAPVPEIGQGVRTALPMLVAEELDVDWTQVKVKQAMGSSEYEGRNQRAAGSNSVKQYWLPMRKAGAVGRDLILRAAAKTWGVDRKHCQTKQGMVINNKTQEQLSYGALVNLAAKLEVDDNVQLKDQSAFTLLGQSIKNVDGLNIAQGKVKFGTDIKIPGMVYASIEKSPVYGGKVVSFDDKAAKQVPGFIQTVQVEVVGNVDRPYVRPGVAVIASNTWAAFEARKKLIIEWDNSVNEAESTDKLHAQAQQLLKGDGTVVREDGDVAKSMAQAAQTMTATYQVPFIAHTPMETMNCTAKVEADRAEIWVPTQMPAATLSNLASRLKLEPANIQVNCTRVGGGFGSRLSLEFVLEAIQLAQKTNRIVQVAWTREDQMTQSDYRPFSYHKMTAGVNDKGEVIAWNHHHASTSRYAFRASENPANSEFFQHAFPAHLIKNLKLAYSLIKSNLPRTILRAPGHNTLAFVVESFTDELASKLDKDPLQFRLDLLAGHGKYVYDEEDGEDIDMSRIKSVLEKVAEKSNWFSALPAGQARGVACHFTFGSYVAHVVELTLDPQGRIEKHVINKVVSAVDCGQVANLAGLEAQVEGGIIDGLSATIFGEITVEAGQVQQQNFDRYRLMRLSQAPQKIEVHVIQNNHQPTGMGEPPYPPIGAAYCNALFHAGGVRHRNLPLVTS